MRVKDAKNRIRFLDFRCYGRKKEDFWRRNDVAFIFIGNSNLMMQESVDRDLSTKSTTNSQL